MDRCDPKGRDCFEENSAETFNCSTTCVGVYADVWGDVLAEKNIEEETGDESSETDLEDDVRANGKEVLDKLAELERKMERMEVDLKKVVTEGSVGQKGEKLDLEKYKMLIAEYRKFKTKNIKHFRFSSSGTSTAFGEYIWLWH